MGNLRAKIRGVLKVLLAWAISNWAWGVPAFGGSAVLTALVGWATSAAADIPLPLLILLLLGVFLLAMLPVALLVMRAERWLGIPANSLRAPPSDAQSGSPTRTFDPQTIVTDIHQIDLSGLDRPESFAVFTFTVRNMSGHQIEITGVDGRMTCSGEVCMGAIRLDNSPVRIPPAPSDRRTCRIEQPLSDSMMQHIVMQHVLGEGILYWQLGRLKWLGAVELPQGATALRDCHLGVGDIVVRGPIPRKGPSKLFRFPITFGNSGEFDSSGIPKRI